MLEVFAPHQMFSYYIDSVVICCEMATTLSFNAECDGVTVGTHRLTEIMIKY